MNNHTKEQQRRIALAFLSFLDEQQPGTAGKILSSVQTFKSKDRTSISTILANNNIQITQHSGPTQGFTVSDCRGTFTFYDDPWGTVINFLLKPFLGPSHRFFQTHAQTLPFHDKETFDVFTKTQSLGKARIFYYNKQSQALADPAYCPPFTSGTFRSIVASPLDFPSQTLSIHRGPQHSLSGPLFEAAVLKFKNTGKYEAALDKYDIRPYYRANYGPPPFTAVRGKSRRIKEKKLELAYDSLTSDHERLFFTWQRRRD